MKDCTPPNIFMMGLYMGGGGVIIGGGLYAEVCSDKVPVGCIKLA